MLHTLTDKPLYRLIAHFMCKQRYEIILLVFVSCVIGTFVSVDSFLLGKVIDTIEEIDDIGASNIVQLMLWWIVGYGLWWQCINITCRLYDYLYLKFIPKLQGHVMDELYNYTQYHSHRFFADNMSGRVALRLTEASRSIELIFAWTSEKILRKTAMILCALVTMYFVHPIFAGVFFIWFVAFYALSIAFAKRINFYAKNFSGAKTTLSGKVVDAISNMWTIRIFNAHKRERNYLRQYVDQTVSTNQQMQFFLMKVRFLTGLLCSAMISSMLYWLLVMRSQLLITTGDCVLILSLCVVVIDYTWDLSQEIGDIFEEVGAFAQSMTLVTPHSMPYFHPDKMLNHIMVNEGKIEFRDVYFKYKFEHDLFHGLAVDIPAKQHIGVVGYSGSGKTTFVNLIYRLHDVTSGEILIDGQNIAEVSQESLRENITIIPQDPMLFHRSIMENIRYGRPNATDEEVFAAAEKAHIHDVVMSMEQGYDTVCGERGGALSGGQRQRIAIARAFLKDAPILILDEATSAQDATSEELIQDALHTLMDGKTVIVVAHRLSTLLNMDRILVFKEGAIVEDGTHTTLLTKTNSLYHELWHSHVKGMIN